MIPSYFSVSTVFFSVDGWVFEVEDIYLFIYLLKDWSWLGILSILSGFLFFF